MANENQMTVAQTNTVEPSQANKVVNNIDKISDTQTPVSVLQSNNVMFNNDLKDSFLNSEAWKQYTSNDLRKLQPNVFPGFSAIEKAAENPIWTATIDRYGDAVATRQQAIHSSYSKANGFFGRLGQAYNAQRYGLRSAAARKELSDAILSGNELKISEARNKYQNELKNQYERGYAYDDETANTLMSLLASSGRNWETIPIEVIGALLIPWTGGGSELAARGVNAAIVGADTYNLETGSAIEQLDRLNTDMSEEQKREKSIPVGVTNAAIEAGLFGLGGNIAGIGTRYVGAKVAKQTFKKSLEKRLGKEISDEAANRLYKIKFLGELQKAAGKEGWAQLAKDLALGGAGEGLQEVVQDTNTNAMLSAVENDTAWGDELAKDWASFAKNPFAAEHADKWRTFFNVMITSPVLGGAYRGIGAGTEFVLKGGKQKKFDEIKTKFAGATNNTLGLSRLFDWHKDGDAKSAIGAANAALQEAIATDPNVTGKLYTTVEQVQEMQKDPEVAAALAQMGVAEGLEQAAENGGVVELDLIAYDKIVNEKQNTVLFQKMRNYLSFSETTMSVNEFQQFIKTNIDTVTQQINEEVKNNADSVYNKVRKMFLDAGENEVIANSYAAMAHIMLTGAQGFTQGQTNDVLDRLSININNGQTNVGGLLGAERSQPTVSSKQAYREQNAKDVARIMTNAKPITLEQMKQDFQEVVAQSDKAREQLYATGDDSGFAKNTQHVYVAKAGDGTWYFRINPTGRFEQINKYSNNNSYAKAGTGDSYDINYLDEVVSKIPEMQFFEVPVEEFEALSNEFLTRDHPDMTDVNVGGMVDDVFADKQDQQPHVYHMFVGSRTEETVNNTADKLGKRKELDEARAMEKAAMDKGEMPDYEAI